MIRVTKCPHCQTLFKVTDDQLKLYNGAVRCGICQQIFNGANHLQTEPSAARDRPLSDEEKALPQALPPFSDSAFQAEETPSSAPFASLSDEEDEITLSLSEEDINAPPENAALFDVLEEELSAISMELGKAASQLSVHEQPKPPEPKKEEKRRPAASPAQPEPQAAPSPKKTLEPVFPAKRLANLSLYTDPEEPAETAVQSPAPYLDDAATVTLSSQARSKTAPPDNTLAGQPAPSAVQQEEADPLMDFLPPAHADSQKIPKTAEKTDNRPAKEPDFVKKGRQKKQRGIFSTLLLGVATLILFGILAIQCLYLLSDRMTVWWPPAEPAITKACQLFACPRRLETRISALSIESSELQAVSGLKDKYALSMLLRNSGSAYQSWPHIELTLTDPDKKPTARRVLAPANYLPDAAYITKGIPPYAEESVRLYLRIETEPNADYRISLFYP